MQETVNFDFSKDHLWDFFNKWYAINPEMEKVLPKESCIQKTKYGTVLLTRLNQDPESSDLYPYESGTLSSKAKFNQQYGIFELVCKVPPDGKLYWPAFWLYGDDWPPEIDIFEMMSNKEIGTNKTFNFSTTIHNGIGRVLYKTQKGRGLSGKQDLSKAFHKYSVLWEPYKITWYFDDIEIYQLSKNIPSNRMHVVISNGGGEDPSQMEGKIGRFELKTLKVFKFL